MLPIPLPPNTRLLAAASEHEPAWPLLMAIALTDHATGGDPALTLAVHPQQPGLPEALDHLRAVGELGRVLQTAWVSRPDRLWPHCHAVLSLSTSPAPSPAPRPGHPPLPRIAPSPTADFSAGSQAPRDLAAAVYAWTKSLAPASV